MLVLHKDSHLDHNISKEQLDWVLEQTKDEQGFFVKTLSLPRELGEVYSNLYGPIMGDDPIKETEVIYKIRGNRPYHSRILPNGRPGPTQLITIVSGPHDGQPMVLYTIYGGAVAPKEPGDTFSSDKEREESVKFWAEHALCDS